ncbi:MAG: phage adaptor protein [bacterium]
MLRSAAISIIKSRLGNIQGTDLDNTIVANMQLVQATVLERGQELPWFLEADTNVLGTNLTTVASTETVSLPTDFLRELDEETYCVLRQDATEDSGWAPLQKVQTVASLGRYPGTGEPIRYALLSGRMYLRYIPDDAYTLRLLYYQAATVLSSDVENAWLLYAPDWMIAETCRQTAEDLQLQQLIDKFMNDSMLAKKRVMDETTARREAGFMRAMGED